MGIQIIVENSERIEGNIHLKKELDELKLILKQYVQKEEFEKAAEVRDKIRNLENQLSEYREGNSSMSLDKIMNEAISPWMKGMALILILFK